MISIGAVIAGGVGLGSGAKARLKASRKVATEEVWRNEAEAQKARGDRLEEAMEQVSEELAQVKRQLVRLTEVLRAVAPELVRGVLNDDS
jgi:uncharacterized membrane protein YqiK